jgi:hypothetical protein
MQDSAKRDARSADRNAVRPGSPRDVTVGTTSTRTYVRRRNACGNRGRMTGGPGPVPDPVSQ